jgi:gliding motility-associated protein GldM
MISSTNDVLPLINAQKVDVDGGTGKILMPGNAIGNRKYTGVVRVKAPGEGYEFYPFEGEYQVAPKVAVVSPKMMNVMYIGLDNSIDVSVPGVAASDVTASFDGPGKLVKNTDGSYTALPDRQGQVKIIVKAKVNGRDMVMGTQEFRAKIVPSPISTVDFDYEGGKISLAKMKVTRALIPKVVNFDFKAKFTVESYKMSYRSHKDNNVSLPITVTGPLFDDKVKDIMQHRLQAGDDVFFDDIMVRGPAGDRRKINPLAFAVVQ